MKTILKIMGLPRTGRNLLHLLVSLNFKNYVCNKNKWDFDVDYLGWKHHYAPDIKTINLIENRTGEYVIFLFSHRDFEDWQRVMKTKHMGRSELLTKFQKDLDKDPIIYNSISGPKIYSNFKELYDDYNDSYFKFIKDNPERSALINYKNLIKNQSEIVYFIKDKFPQLELAYDKPVIIKKEINSEGQMIDFKV
jgi:hypothetical protein